MPPYIGPALSRLACVAAAVRQRIQCYTVSYIYTAYTLYTVIQYPSACSYVCGAPALHSEDRYNVVVVVFQLVRAGGYAYHPPCMCVHALCIALLLTLIASWVT